MKLAATARSHSNIAFVKYWGNRSESLRLPETGSISMCLAGLDTTSTVSFEDSLAEDSLTLNGSRLAGPPLERVRRHLDNIRKIAGISLHATVTSENSFPMGAGIASSASAFAALTKAACSALGLDLPMKTLSALARLGSGSASRSIPGGYVEWHAGYNHDTSLAETIAPADHWELVDLVAVVNAEHKATGSTGGHLLARTSPFQAARVAETGARLAICREAILARDFEALAEVSEAETLSMHAVMMTSRPALLYWAPETLALIRQVGKWRSEGLPVFFTIDAGPNVHVITTAPYRERISGSLSAIDGVQEVLSAPPGGPTVLLEESARLKSAHGRGTGIQV